MNVKIHTHKLSRKKPERIWNAD